MWPVGTLNDKINLRYSRFRAHASEPQSRASKPKSRTQEPSPIAESDSRTQESVSHYQGASGNFFDGQIRFLKNVQKQDD